MRPGCSMFVVTTWSPAVSPTPHMTAFIAWVELWAMATSEAGHPSMAAMELLSAACRTRPASTAAPLIRPRPSWDSTMPRIAAAARSGRGPAPPVLR